MKPTEILSQEHRLIEVVLDCLEKMAEEAAETQQIDEPAAREAIEFFRDFADGCHHWKEENQLFPALEGKGFGGDTGPLCVMLYEHTVARDALRGMEQSMGEHAGGDAHAAGRFVRHARRYLNVLRQHIEKEDHCLFAMADQAFSASEQAELLDRFWQAERQGTGEAAKRKLLESARGLAERCQVDSAAVTAVVCGSPT